MAIHVDPEDSSVVSFFSWKASNKPDYEDITSRSGDVEGIASTANFSCLVTDRSSGSEIGGLYDALAENYSDHEEKINKLYADLNDPLLNSVLELIPRRIKQVEEEYEKAKSKF